MSHRKDAWILFPLFHNNDADGNNKRLSSRVFSASPSNTMIRDKKIDDDDNTNNASDVKPDEDSNNTSNNVILDIAHSKPAATPVALRHAVKPRARMITPNEIKRTLSVKFSTLQTYMTKKKCLRLRLFSYLLLAIAHSLFTLLYAHLYRKDNKDKASLIALYNQFIAEASYDMRLLGLVIIQMTQKHNLTNSEKTKLLKSDFNFESLSIMFELGRLFKVLLI